VLSGVIIEYDGMKNQRLQLTELSTPYVDSHC
jgi:hypothetical protein